MTKPTELKDYYSAGSKLAHTFTEGGIPLSYTRALEVLAALHGQTCWRALRVNVDAPRLTGEQAVRSVVRRLGQLRRKVNPQAVLACLEALDTPRPAPEVRQDVAGDKKKRVSPVDQGASTTEEMEAVGIRRLSRQEAQQMLLERSTLRGRVSGARLRSLVRNHNPQTIRFEGATLTADARAVLAEIRVRGVIRVLGA